MSNSPPTSDAPVAGARQRPTAGTLLDRAMRLAIMLVIVAAGWMLVQTFRSVLHDAPAAPDKNAPRQKSEPASEPARGFPVEQLSQTFLRPGAWSLGESDWALSLIDLSIPDAEARLQSLGNPTTGQSKTSPLEESILVWLRQFRPAIVDGCRVYNAPLGAARLRVVTENRGGRERLRLAQVLWKQGSSARLMEASVVPASTVSAKGGGHLLPLPAGVATLARRWDNGGNLSCELVGPASPEDCLRQWSNAGWTAEKISEGQDLFSATILHSGAIRVRLYTIESGAAGSPPYLLLMTESVEQ